MEVLGDPVVFLAVNKSPLPSHLWSMGHSHLVKAHLMVGTAVCALSNLRALCVESPSPCWRCSTGEGVCAPSCVGLFDIEGTRKRHCCLVVLSNSLPPPCTPSEYK